jgi:uncharacterized membrane protein YedE/YeeE
MMRAVLASASGLIFGLGLLLSGMNNPQKVQSFLDLSGTWDPSLALVMAGAVAVSALACAVARRRERSLSGDLFEWPRKLGIDTRLLAGGALFGLGWGLAGFCPGPALVAMSSGMTEAWIFGIAMLAGMAAHDRIFS